MVNARSESGQSLEPIPDAGWQQSAADLEGQGLDTLHRVCTKGLPYMAAKAGNTVRGKKAPDCDNVGITSQKAL